MDPSLSDPHHPPSQYPPFATSPTSNNSFVSGHVTAPTHPFSGEQPVNQIPFDHGYQPLPQPMPLPLPQSQSQPQPLPQAQPEPQSQSQPLPLPQPQSQSQPLPLPQQQMPPSQAAQLPPTPSLNHPSYTEMICGAIVALNEPGGSSKMAISRFIEGSNLVLPPFHGALMTHHLKTLKNSGVLTMVKKSYKIAGSSPPESVAVAAAAADAGLVAPRSEIPPTNTGPLDLVAVSASGSASQPQKRGRGRPPKPKPEAPQQQQPLNVQPIAVISNGLPSREQPELPVTIPNQVVTESAKRRPGRPRKDGSVPIVPTVGMPQAAGMAVIMKRRGRPPGRRAAGRQRKPMSVSPTASVFPFVANGGRPRRVESGGVATVAPADGEAVAVAPGMKRGRGRPPRIGGVMNRLITKPKRGRPVGRPRKNTTWPVRGATGTLEVAYGELKRKLDLATEKAKEILNVLKSGIASGDVQAVAQAREELEGLIPMLAVEPQQVKEEVQPEEAAPQTEAETQGDEHGQEIEGGGEQGLPQPLPLLLPQPQPQLLLLPQPQPQPQTEAEAMKEALF